MLNKIWAGFQFAIHIQGGPRKFGVLQTVSGALFIVENRQIWVYHVAQALPDLFKQKNKLSHFGYPCISIFQYFAPIQI